MVDTPLMYYHLWGCVQSTRVHLWEHKLLSSEQNVWTDIPLQTCVMPPETVIIPHSTPLLLPLSSKSPLVKKNYPLWGDPEYWQPSFSSVTPPDWTLVTPSELSITAWKKSFCLSHWLGSAPTLLDLRISNTLCQVPAMKLQWPTHRAHKASPHTSYPSPTIEKISPDKLNLLTRYSGRGFARFARLLS